MANMFDQRYSLKYWKNFSRRFILRPAPIPILSIAPALSELFSHEFPVGLREKGNVVEDIPPQVVVVPLFLYPSLFVEAEPAGPVEYGTGILFIADGHFPFNKDGVIPHHRAHYLHVQFLGPPGQSLGHA